MSHLGHRISALIDGELTAAERDRVLVHLARCDTCRCEAAALRMLKRRMNALGEAAADSALTSRLMAMAMSGGPAMGRGEHDNRGARPVRYAVAGCFALLLIGLGTGAFAAGGAHNTPSPRVTPAVDLYIVQRDITIGVAPAARLSPRPARLGHQNVSVHRP